MTNPPRHYFLNHGHELAHSEKAGGGRLPKFGTIDWARRGQVLTRSLTSARDSIKILPDPTVTDRLFLLAIPVKSVPKHSDDKKKYPSGQYEAEPTFSGQDSLAFRRLGIDLVDVSADGSAVVHVPSSGIDRILQTTSSLATEGRRQQARWATMGRFELVPLGLKVDREWLGSFESKISIVECSLKLHALLTRHEVEMVLEAIVAVVLGKNEKIVRVDRSFSGRPRIQALLTRKSIERIGTEFPSVQAIHRPLLTILDGSHRPRGSSKTAAAPPNALPHSDFPVVAIVDGGIPKKHPVLANYLLGRYSGRGSHAAETHPHGSAVASRVVFGELDFYDGTKEPPPAQVLLIDVSVADQLNSNESEVHIREEDVVQVMGDVIKGNPEVRVFNLSFSGKPLNNLEGTEDKERLMNTQDLDNFIFLNDVLVVVAAGNSQNGAQPTRDYPLHVEDPRWKMGAWATGVNTLKCGAYVGHVVPEGIVRHVGWPSPFTRIGPPVSGAAAPEFSATGGDLGQNYRHINGAGVWCCDESGMWIDLSGTSFAAPLLAREAALTLQNMTQVAGRPFAVLVRAFLSITARVRGKESFSPQVKALAERTLGRGFPKASDVTVPVPERAFVFWQGILEGVGDIARVQLPLPERWLSNATEPRVRLVVCWDPPVNHAVTHLWSCRKLTVTLKPSPTGPALRPAKNVSRGSSPVIERIYDISKNRLEKRNLKLEGDFWGVELYYEESAAYSIGLPITPKQRVAFVAELYDDAKSPISPHEEIQKLKAAQSMTKLSAFPMPIPATLLVTSR